MNLDPAVATAIVALRPALEGLVVRAAKDPETITDLSPLEEKTVSVIKELCKINAGRYGMEQLGNSGYVIC